MGGLPRRAIAINRHVQAIVSGKRMKVAYAYLATKGDAAIDAVFAATRRGCPAARHRNDWDSDLTGVLIHVANVDPWPLVQRIKAGADGSMRMLWALGRCKHRDMKAALRELLSDKRSVVREEAAVALGRRRDKRALEPLLALLGARYLSFDVFEAVVCYDDPRIIEPLEKLIARGRLPMGSMRMAREAIKRARRKALPAALTGAE